MPCSVLASAAGTGTRPPPPVLLDAPADEPARAATDGFGPGRAHTGCRWLLGPLADGLGPVVGPERQSGQREGTEDQQDLPGAAHVVAEQDGHDDEADGDHDVEDPV